MLLSQREQRALSDSLLQSRDARKERTLTEGAVRW